MALRLTWLAPSASGFFRSRGVFPYTINGSIQKPEPSFLTIEYIFFIYTHILLKAIWKLICQQLPWVAMLGQIGLSIGARTDVGPYSAGY